MRGWVHGCVVVRVGMRDCLPSTRWCRSKERISVSSVSLMPHDDCLRRASAASLWRLRERKYRSSASLCGARTVKLRFLSSSTLHSPAVPTAAASSDSCDVALRASATVEHEAAGTGTSTESTIWICHLCLRECMFKKKLQQKTSTCSCAHMLIEMQTHVCVHAQARSCTHVYVRKHVRACIA